MLDVYQNKNRILAGYSRVLLIMISIIINTFLLLYASVIKDYSFNEWITIFFMLSIIQLTFNIYVVVKLGESILSLSVLFLFFSYIFHFGYIPLLALSFEELMLINVLGNVPRRIFMDACYYVFLVQSFLALGMLIILSRPIKLKKTFQLLDERRESIELKKINLIGKVLFLVGLIPTIYIDIKKLVLFFTQGYLATYTLNLSGFIYTIAMMWETGVLMLIISNKNNKRKARLIVTLTLAYLTIIMLSGNRGRPIVFILTMIFVYFNFIESINLKKFFKYSMFGYFGVVFLNAMTNLRQLSNPSMSRFIDYFIEGMFGSVILRTLGEFGGTIITLCYAIMYFPSYSPFQCGKNYMFSLFMIFPNVGGILNETTRISTYTSMLPSDVRRFLGGSYIGELYYSFGSFGFIFSIIIGMAVALISIKMRKSIMNKNYIKLSILLTLFPGVLWWVRGYFSGMVRDFIWISTSIIILNLYFKGLLRRDYKV